MTKKKQKIEAFSEPRVVVVTMELTPIVQLIANQYNIVGIIQSAPRNRSGQKQGNRIYYFLQDIGHMLGFSNTLKGFSRGNNIPYFYMSNGSDLELERWVKHTRSDLMIIYTMSQLMGENIYSIPKYGTINLHSSYLPKYRGPNPIFWNYYNMDHYGGITLHFIDKGEDTGDIIYQEYCPIQNGMRLADYNRNLIDSLGMKMIRKALENYTNLPRTTQPVNSPTPRARNLKNSEHKEIIDWENWGVERIWHVLRGSEGWLNALVQPQGKYKGQRWSIGEFEKCDTAGYMVSKIYKRNNRYFVVCSDGKIFLTINFKFKTFIKTIMGTYG